MSFISQPPQPPEMPFEITSPDGTDKLRVFSGIGNRSGAVTGTWNGAYEGAQISFVNGAVRCDGARPTWFDAGNGLRYSAMQDETMSGHTWQDVTGSRALYTIYQNTSGRPIDVSVLMRPGGNAPYFEVSETAATWVKAMAGHSNDDRAYFGPIRIAPQVYYRVEPGNSVLHWAEFRP